MLYKTPLRFRQKGFTLTEILIFVVILVILTAMAVPSFRFFQRESDLNNTAEEIINALRLAQNKTQASEATGQWGVYFATSATPHQYTIFKGTNFSSRNSAFDGVFKLPENVEIYGINLSTGSQEVIFDRITGTTNQSGAISLRLKNDPAKTKTIYIENSGLAGLTNPAALSDESRIKDSRHVHINYSRVIATATESLILTFEGGVTETIVIADNMQNGQIDWEREVMVGGAGQKIKIHTHRFNNPDTQFSIHRDRRYNNKSLIIDIGAAPDPDPGNIADYSADGLTVTKTSNYATSLQWQ